MEWGGQADLTMPGVYRVLALHLVCPLQYYPRVSFPVWVVKSQLFPTERRPCLDNWLQTSQKPA